MSLHNFPGCDKKLILDVSLTHPIPILCKKGLSMAQAVQSYRAADIRYAANEKTYGAIANSNNLKFLPIIFETTGSMHPVTIKFFESVIQHMSNVNDTKAKLMNF